MVAINIAYTAPTQVWAGLERKVRRAQDFVPIIISCDLLSEEQTEKGFTITRKVKFKGAGPKGDGSSVTEVCAHYAPSRVDFEQDNGSFISNIVSKGPDGELLMTYSFAWLHPDVAEGSNEVEKSEAEHWKVRANFFLMIARGLETY
ncbi:hypothetical protein BKA67DRAFT_583756 [Truncatella angustata]|uniref:Uncharacterized protein n=1 Tax=Truncatella angustata TaxID=152316 RepID=A0A9P8UC53_9PEZI|nr:uncharacterized protein BKA67DRAFT_583756 [Truncatella angustata]KAH6646281.1 hypothetical protein BKA67DRAFT_583756 [Truncatella angustata]